jgi:enamine deaminase RidA (YjgF/YER057c/UK114 family)
MGPDAQHYALLRGGFERRAPNNGRAFGAPVSVAFNNMNCRTVFEQDEFLMTVSAPAADLRWIVVSVRPGADSQSAAAAAYSKIRQLLNGNDWQCVHERIFGSLGHRQNILQGRAGVGWKMLESAVPPTFIQGHPVWGEGFAGIQLQFFKPIRTGERVWNIGNDGQAYGRGWTRRGVTSFMLQGLHGLRASAPGTPSEQTIAMIQKAEQLLKSQGTTYGEVARTWIYLRDILTWYDDFNQARNRAYSGLGLMPSATDTRPVAFHLPASTGIKGANAFQAACMMDVLAVAGDPAARPNVLRLTNLRQKDAFRYGAAFSRGVILAEADYAQIQISGTAAIDEAGKSLYPGDTRAQIERTLENIEALIAQGHAKLTDIASATVFLKRAEDFPIWQEIAARRGLIPFPGVCVVADVCRDDLLFELDGLALVAKA